MRPGAPKSELEPESDDGYNQHLEGDHIQDTLDVDTESIRQTQMADDDGTWSEVKRKDPRVPRPVNSVTIADDMMTTYKTRKCTNDFQHDWRACPHWHGSMDQRRSPFQHDYEPVMCSDVAKCIH